MPLVTGIKRVFEKIVSAGLTKRSFDTGHTDIILDLTSEERTLVG